MKTRQSFISSVSLMLTGLLCSATAHAQGKSVNQLLNTTKNVARSNVDDFVDIALIVLGLGGVLLAVIGAVNTNSGNQEAMPKMVKGGLGILGAVLLIEVYRIMIG